MKKYLILFATMVAIICMCFSASAANKEVENNDKSGLATSIKAGTTYSAVIENDEDIDWFKFSNDKNYFTFAFTPSTENADAIGIGWNITIYDSSVKNVLKEYPDITEAFVTPKMPYSGDIYVKIISYSAINCPYSIKANTISNQWWESENNNNPLKADNITLGATFYGVLNDEYDIDCYQFISNYDCFYLTFNYSPSNNIGLINDGWTVSILTSNGETVLKEYSESNSFNSVKLPYKGKFYIKVKSVSDIWYHAPIDCYYSLKVVGVRGKYETENNDSAKQATQITKNTTYTGVLNNWEDVDYYKFSSTNQHFRITFKYSVDKSYSSEINNGWNIIIYASNGNTVLKNYKNKVDSFTTINIEGQSTVYVCIESSGYTENSSPVDCYYTISTSTGNHYYQDIIKKATITKDGKITPTCKYCNAKKTSTIIKKASKISISNTSFKYNGKIRRPTVIVKDSAGKTIDSKNYTIKWSEYNSKKIGTYKVTITFKNNYSGTKQLTYKIVK